jgi:hypothetical protein
MLLDVVKKREGEQKRRPKCDITLDYEGGVKRI